MKNKKLILILAFIIPILISMTSYVPLFYGADSYYYFNNVLENQDSSSAYMNLVTDVINIFPEMSLHTTALICKIFNSIVFGLSGIFLVLALHHYLKSKNIVGLDVRYLGIIFMYSIMPTIIQRLNFNYFDTDPVILLCFNLLLYSYFKKGFVSMIIYWVSILIFIEVWGNSIYLIFIILLYSILELLLMAYNQIKGLKLKYVRDWNIIQKLFLCIIISFGTGFILIIYTLGERFFMLFSDKVFSSTAELQPSFINIICYIFMVLFILYKLGHNIIHIFEKSIIFRISDEQSSSNKYKCLSEMLKKKETFISYLCIVFFSVAFFMQRVYLFLVPVILIYIWGIRKDKFYYDNKDFFGTALIFILLISMLYSIVAVLVIQPYYIPNHFSPKDINPHGIYYNRSVDNLVLPHQYGYYASLWVDENITIVLNGGNYNNDINKTCSYYKVMCMQDYNRINVYSNVTYYMSIKNSTDPSNKVMCEFCINRSVNK